jgi:hypothetical protein
MGIMRRGKELSGEGALIGIVKKGVGMISFE